MASLRDSLPKLLPAVLLRLLFYLLFKESDAFINRPEFSTPLTSYKYLSECITLKNRGLDPYQGDMCHELPVMVNFYEFLGNLAYKFGYFEIDFKTSLFVALVLFDCLSGILIGKVGHSWCKRYNSDNDTKSLSENFFTSLFLYNPISIISCLSLSTQVIYNSCLLCFLHCLDQVTESMDTNQKAHYFYFGALSFAVSAVGQIWPAQLIFPCLFFTLFGKKDVPKANLAAFTFTSILFAFFYYKFNVVFDGNGNAFKSIYNFILTAPDYSPNTGIWWYLIIEMFEHFRQLFINVLQVNVFFYTIPLCLFFRERFQDLNLIMFLLISVIGIFKSYTTLTDLLVPLSLIFSFNRNLPYRKAQFIAWIAFFICVSLCPIMWSQWVVLGRGNANFYFAVTLGIVASCAMIVSDVLYGHLLMQYKQENNLGKDDKVTFGSIVFQKPKTD